MSLRRLEATVRAWRDCEPDDWTLPASRFPPLLSRICLRVPHCMDTPEAAQELDDFFGVGGQRGRTIPFFALLDLPLATDGRVHFLLFWRAFDVAARIAAAAVSAARGGDGCSGAMAADGGAKHGRGGTLGDRLAGELELFREALLALAGAPRLGGGLGERPRGKPPASAAPEEVSAPSPGRVPAAEALALASAARRASVCPGVWARCSEDLTKLSGPSGVLDLEELTALLVPRLLEAVDSARPPQPARRPATPMMPRQVVDRHRAPTQAPEVKVANCGCFAVDATGDEGLPVYLNVYDVSHERGLQRLNKVLAYEHAPLKFGGIFHVGVEVAGAEWSYGFTRSRRASGVSSEDPRSNPDHRFRQTVFLGRTQLTAEHVEKVLHDISKEYRGRDYDVLRRNCCHFAEDLGKRLGVRRPPGWVQRFGRLGARLDNLLQGAPALRNRLFSMVLGDVGMDDTARKAAEAKRARRTENVPR